MSYIVATVTKIEYVKQLHIVEFDFQGLMLKMMSLDLNLNVQLGKKVVLTVKPTNIAVSKDFQGDISLSNKIVATIDHIENGELLSSITLHAKGVIFESIITVTSAQRMNLQTKDEVTLFIKASDLSILEVIND
jgi:molybdopterin-binding protein